MIATGEKLVRIDCILESLQNEKADENNQALVAEFCRAVADAVGIEYADSKDLFDEKLEFNGKRFVAICLLRLWDVNDFLFEKIDFRIKALKLFDDVLHDVYKQLKISPKDQSFEKESKLKGIVLKVENELSNLVNAFNSLKALNNFRSKFLQLINSQLVKAIMWPFLPRNLLDLRLKEAFKCIEDYINAEGPQILIAYDEAKTILESYISQAKAIPTKYCKEVLIRPVARLLNLLQAHFEASPASKPAELIVERFEKKYPFHVLNTEINLVFVVTNKGSGYAFDTELNVSDATVPILKPRQYLGNILPGASMEVVIPCKLESPEDVVMIDINISYGNYDGSRNEHNFLFELYCQRKDIDWDELSKKRPYSLEPVSSEEEFAGRTEILSKLESLITAGTGVGSAFLYGQKRVGKTSIVKILKARLQEKYASNFLVIYLEGGDYIHPDPKITIENLGRKMVKSIQTADTRFAGLSVPDFRGALSPITDFLEAVLQLEPRLKIVFILDEFDELPVDLYKTTPIGDAFFLTLRSISGKPPFGFILVGGEKMEFIIALKGGALNKFEPIRVDYFDKEQHWTDFQDLVVKPVKGWLEISDKALSTLHDETSGNPFFTKLICRDLFELMVKRRDCYVTHREVLEASRSALSGLAGNVFQHFWEDGILGSDPQAEEKSVLRRKVLLGFADVRRTSQLVTLETIKNNCQKWRVPPDLTEEELREFERRQVLVRTERGYGCKVKLFEKWLVDKGYNELVTGLATFDLLARRKQEEEKIRVTSEEIVHLIQQWGPYKGKLLTEDRIRAWLNQFGGNKEQRLMFKILQGVRFYSGDIIRSKLKEAHGIVTRGVIHQVKAERRKRSDNILVSYLDAPGKSGAYLAKIYVDENGILPDNVIEKSKIAQKVQEKSTEFPYLALVFVDDFVGTGNSACEYFKGLCEEQGEILKKMASKPGEFGGIPKLNIYFVAICGFQEAKARIEETLAYLDLPVKVHICDPLTQASKAFDDSSQIFEDEYEREEAKKIAYGFGTKLVKKAPLGYGDCQATVVFEHGCPNNSLPILWQQTKDFIPIFHRK